MNVPFDDIISNKTQPIKGGNSTHGLSQTRHSEPNARQQLSSPHTDEPPTTGEADCSSNSPRQDGGTWSQDDTDEELAGGPRRNSSQVTPGQRLEGIGRESRKKRRLEGPESVDHEPMVSNTTSAACMGRNKTLNVLGDSCQDDLSSTSDQMTTLPSKRPMSSQSSSTQSSVASCYQPQFLSDDEDSDKRRRPKEFRGDPSSCRENPGEIGVVHNQFPLISTQNANVAEPPFQTGLMRLESRPQGPTMSQVGRRVPPQPSYVHTGPSEVDYHRHPNHVFNPYSAGLGSNHLYESHHAGNPTYSAHGAMPYGISSQAVTAPAGDHLFSLGLDGNPLPPQHQSENICPENLQSSNTSGPSGQEMLTLYQNASEAPSRLPAHKPVRLKHPKHVLAPQNTAVYFKYGEEHYPEESVPDAYTFTESDGTICRYITNFLVYNKRGERLLPIEVLDQPRHGALVLYGSLLPAAGMGVPSAQTPSGGNSSSNDSAEVSRVGRRGERRKSSSRRRGEDDCPGQPPYPIRAELSEWCIDYGQEPQNVPFVWLISRWDVYYRLEKPAGRYIPTFSTAKMKFEVSTRIIKTLQWRPDFPYREMVDLLTAASRHERHRKRLEDERRKRRERSRRQGFPTKGGGSWDSSDPVNSLGCGDECLSDDDTQSCFAADGGDHARSQRHAQPQKKAARPNWKVNSSLSTPEGTGVAVPTADGQPGPLTTWKAPFAVENVRESTLLGLTDFLESQMRNFLDGVGGVGGTCANLVETRFMQTLREKASLRRETMQLVEAKKRSIESMTAVNGFSHLGGPSPFDLGGVGSPPLVALQILQPTVLRQNLPPNTQVTQGCAMASPLVTVGFTGESNNPHHHQAMMILKTRQQEEQELNQLLHLLKEFSDPEDGMFTNCLYEESSEDGLGNTSDLDDLESSSMGGSSSMSGQKKSMSQKNTADMDWLIGR